MKTRNILITIAGVLVLLAVAGVLQARALLNRPLSPHLVLQLQQADKTPTPTATKEGGTPQPTKTAQPTKPSDGVCNETGSMVILGIGYDQTIETPFGADTIRYIKADFDTPAITVIALPRDLWLQTTALEEQDISETTLGKLFYFSYQGAPGTSREKLATASTDLNQTLYDSFGVVPDNYATLELSSMVALIDAVGGVDVNIPEEFTSGDVTFQPGKQNLDGQQATLYMRALPDSSSEWDRFSRQDLILIALREKLLSVAAVSKLGELIKIYQEAFITDLSPAQAMHLECLVQEVSVDNIEFKEVGPEMVSPGPEGSMLPDIPAITEFLTAELGE